MIWSEIDNPSQRRDNAPGSIELAIGSTESFRNNVYVYGDVTKFNEMIQHWHRARTVTTGNLDNDTLLIMREDGDYFIVMWTDVRSMRYLGKDSIG